MPTIVRINLAVYYPPILLKNYDVESLSGFLDELFIKRTKEKN